MTRPAIETRVAPTPAPSPGNAVKHALAVVALALIASAFFLPLWTSALSAPQYPEGLSLVVYGNRAEGDLAEIDSLNHYIGMRPLRVEEMPELALWPLGLAAAAAAALVGSWMRGIPARLAKIYLWVFPISILAVIQFRLHQFGHDLDPSAAFRMDGFTPWVIGPTTVWNFTAWSMPGLGILALLGAAAVVAAGPWVINRLRRAGTGAVITAVLVVVALPAAAQTDPQDHDHSGHDHSGIIQAPPAPDLSSGPAAAPVPNQMEIDHSRLGDLASLIGSVPDGGTLRLPPGAYRGDLVIDRPITLIGEGMPVIVGHGHGTVLTLEAPGTVLRGIQVTGSGHGPGGQPAGIRVAADSVEIDGVVVTDSYIGIAVGDAEGVRILDSLVMGRAEAAIGSDSHAVEGSHESHTGGGRGDGVSIWESKAVLVRGTTIVNARDGIYVSFAASVLIDSNHVASSRYAVHTMYGSDLVLIENRFDHNLSGAVLMYGGSVDVIRNVIADNTSLSTGFGILLKDVTDAEVVQNAIAGNRVGIHVDGPAGGAEPVRVTANTVADNQFGVVVYPSAAATFMANSFVDNLVQVSQQGRGEAAGVAWADRGWGNYWSTYRGYDNGQGKGAVAHGEASSVNRLLVRSPMLASLATSPAMRIVGAVEERWLRAAPVAIDEMPLMAPVSPAYPQDPGEPAAAVSLAVAGLVLTAAASTGLLRFSRRPRLAS